MKFDIAKLTSLDEKWLLVEQLRVGQCWKDRLTLAGANQLNLHSKTFRLIAHQLAGPLLAKTNCILVGDSAIHMVIQQVLSEAQQANQLTYFSANLTESGNLAQLLAKTYYELRMSGLDPSVIPPTACEVPAKANDLNWIYGNVQQRLQQLGWVDDAWCIHQVMAGLRSGSIRLPDPLHILQPEQFPTYWLQQQLLASLVAGGAQHHLTPELISASGEPPRTHTQSAIGAINEVRALFHHILYGEARACPLDHFEVAVTNYERYIPLLFEYGLHLQTEWSAEDSSVDSQATSEGSTPATSQGELSNASAVTGLTFADGIPCIYSRPGRLLRSWVRWLRTDCQQSKAVEIIREGLLNRPGRAEQCGYARMANTLRRIPIGFGLDRYLPAIDQAMTDAQDLARDHARTNLDATQQRDFGMSAVQALRDTLTSFIQLSQAATKGGRGLLQSARQLLIEHARAEARQDRYARAKLIDDLDLMLQLMATAPPETFDLYAWLEGLPVSSRILAQSPQPGCLHVTSLEQGATAARRHVFVLGLSAELYPQPITMDPILLDHERTAISNQLPTSRERTAHQYAALERLMRRMSRIPQAQVTLSYSTRDLSEDRESWPSHLAPQLLKPSHQPWAFISHDSAAWLTNGEHDCHALLQQPEPEARAAHLFELYPHLNLRAQARQTIQQERFSAFDGHVPAAGQDALQQIEQQAFSPSRLEVLGTCPRRYFFQRALTVRPPDQYSIDPDRWLSPVHLGSLLHALLEDFVQELIRDWSNSSASDQSASNTFGFVEHWPRLAALLQHHLDRIAQRIPPPGDQAFDDTREELVTMCEIFLKAEEVYARERSARPKFLEVALGSTQENRPTTASGPLDTDQPIEITLVNGRTIRLLGRVDRVDQLMQATGTTYLVWDYKSGSQYGYSVSDPFKQGRRLQHYLYVRMLQARLAALGQTDATVHGFGYFFPNTKAEGLRLEWPVDELAAGDRITTALLDLLLAGTFIATDQKDDCGMCDYTTVCGQPETLVQLTKSKTKSILNPELSAWRTLRSAKCSE